MALVYSLYNDVRLRERERESASVNVFAISLVILFCGDRAVRIWGGRE